MADSLLNSSITAVRTKIINDIASASIKDLVSLARAAKSIGLGDDSDVENAINTRVNSFASSATVDEIKDLSQAIKQVKNEYAATINNADDISDGTDNKFLSTTNLNTELGSLSTNIIPDTDISRNLGSAGNKFNTIYGAKVTGLLSPIDAGDAATKAYVDANIAVTDISDLTDTSGVIPDDVSDLTDTTGLLGSGGANAYSAIGDLPITGNDTGDMAFVTSTNNLYIYKTNGWFKIATVENLQPGSISGVNTSYKLATDGTPTVITATATDPEGFPLTWSYAVTAGSLGSTATVSQADNVFTITPSTSQSDEGSFSITFSVTDGVNGAVNAVSAFTLTFGWTVDLSNVTYDSVSFSISSQDGNPVDVRFNSDGTKMYVVGYGADSIFQYSLSSGFDVSTASYDNVSFSFIGNGHEGRNPRGFSFNDDGTKMYVSELFSTSVYQYSLSTAFDISTASYDSVSFAFTSQTGASSEHDLAFSQDGTKMYVLGNSNGSVYQYSLSTGFDLSTASYDSISFSVSSQDSSPLALIFNTDGTKMYVVGITNDTVYQYTLSTGFDLSTASYDSISFSISGQEDAARGIEFSNDGTKMYIIGSGSDTVYQYSTGL